MRFGSRKINRPRLDDSNLNTTKRQSPYLSTVYLGEGRSLRIGAQLVPALRCGGRRRRTEGLGHRVGMAREIAIPTDSTRSGRVVRRAGLDSHSGVVERDAIVAASFRRSGRIPAVDHDAPQPIGVARKSRHTMRPMPRMTSSV